MKENFLKLRKEFNLIKKRGLISPLRKGTTGLGYTFERLLNKKEDSLSDPDYYGIEIKTKFGYSKSPLTLFNCVPIRYNEKAINYLFKNYSYKKYKDNNTFIFERELYVNKSLKKYNYEFRLFVDYYGKRVILKVFFKENFIEDVCYWNFYDLEKKLKIKLNFLAIVTAYPYKIGNKLYYKYLKMNIYKLKDFYYFLKLIENDKIFVQFYLKKHINDEFIINDGIAFRIDINYIDKLFVKLNY